MNLTLFNSRGSQTSTPPTTPVLSHYYVSSSGSDSGSGDISNPWATIGKANTQTFKPGDVLSFNGGNTFTGNLIIRQSGSSGNPILINSYGTGRATINGGDTDGITLQDVQYVNVNNIKCQGSGVSVTGGTTSFGAGIALRSSQASGAKYTGIQITGNLITGFRTGILLAVDNGTTPQTLWRGFDQTVIDGNEVSFCALAGIFTWSKSSGSPGFASGQFPEIGNNAGYVFTNLTITNNYVHDMYGSATATGANANFGTGIRLVNVNGGFVNSNRVDSVGHHHNIGTPAGFESEFSANVDWRYNEVSNVIKDDTAADGAGFDIFDGGTINMSMEYNYIHDNDGYGIGGGGTPDGGSTGHRVGFNILVNNNRDGNLGDIQIWGGMDNIIFYNNTVFSNLNGGKLIDIPAGMSNSYFTNNIFVSLGTRIIASLTAGTVPLFLNNLYWRGSGIGLGFVIGGTTCNTLSDLVSHTQETHSGVNRGFIGDAFFTNAGLSTAFLMAAPVKNMNFYDIGSSSQASGNGVPINTLIGGAIMSEGTLDYHLITITAINSIGAVQLNIA